MEKVKKELAEANARIKELEKENAELTEKYTKEQILITLMNFIYRMVGHRHNRVLIGSEHSV